jgi:predicted  nucleic acid-binding Zn-ribbon protein
MRPNAETEGAKVHECLKCGSRFDAPDARVCPDCGADLLDLGKSRDF